MVRGARGVRRADGGGPATSVRAERARGEEVGGRGSVARPALRVEEPEVRPPARRPVWFRATSTSVRWPTTSRPRRIQRPPGELEPEPGRLVEGAPERGGQPGGSRTRRSAPARRASAASRPSRSASAGGRRPSRVGRVRVRRRGMPPLGRQVDEEEVDRPRLEERPGHRQRLVQRAGDEDHEPLQAGRPGRPPRPDRGCGRGPPRRRSRRPPGPPRPAAGRGSSRRSSRRPGGRRCAAGGGRPARGARPARRTRYRRSIRPSSGPPASVSFGGTDRRTALGAVRSPGPRPADRAMPSGPGRPGAGTAAAPRAPIVPLSRSSPHRPADPPRGAAAPQRAWRVARAAAACGEGVHRTHNRTAVRYVNDLRPCWPAAWGVLALTPLATANATHRRSRCRAASSGPAAVARPCAQATSDRATVTGPTGSRRRGLRAPPTAASACRRGTTASAWRLRRPLRHAGFARPTASARARHHRLGARPPGRRGRRGSDGFEPEPLHWPGPLPGTATPSRPPPPGPNELVSRPARRPTPGAPRRRHEAADVEQPGDHTRPRTRRSGTAPTAAAGAGARRIRRAAVTGSSPSAGTLTALDAWREDRRPERGGRVDAAGRRARRRAANWRCPRIAHTVPTFAIRATTGSAAPRPRGSDPS